MVIGNRVVEKFITAMLVFPCGEPLAGLFPGQMRPHPNPPPGGREFGLALLVALEDRLWVSVLF